jgi:hypothetical protein
MSNCADPDQPTPSLGTLLRSEQALSGVKAYEAAIDQVLALALGHVRIFERRLGRDYNAQPRIDILRAFLLADRTRRVAIVVHDAGNIRIDCPRLVVLQRHFGHGLAIHRTQSLARGVYDPFCVADGSHYARRFHYDSMRGVLVMNDPDRAGELVQRFTEIWEVSQPAITGTTLGL